MAKALRDLGHDVSIVTTNAAGRLDSDSPWVVRSGDLQSSAALRRLLRRPGASVNEPGDVPAAADGTAVPPRYLTQGLVPDSWIVTWLPYVLPVVRRVIRDHQIEVVVTNGPPLSTHLLGLALGRGRPAWIADFDDGWRYEPLMGPWPTRIQDRIDKMFERRVATSADAIVGITEPIARDFRERYGCLAFDIPSGWDRADVDAAIDGAAPPQMTQGVVNLVHTGSLSHPERRNPRGFFKALELLVETDPSTADQLRLVLAGELTTDDHAILDALTPAVRSMVEVLGVIAHPEALALQRAADALLLISTGPHRQVVTAKLSEYVLTGRPILAVLSENEAARIVRETQTGTVVAPDDVEVIAEALRQCIDGRLAASFQPRGLERYVQPAPAKEFADVIEAAIASRRIRLTQHRVAPAG